jgi:hypothetical protein
MEAIAQPILCYQHEPLDVEKPQIRLLTFKKSSPDSSATSIFVNLATFDLEKCPKYKALSYMWGPPTPNREIMINGCSFRIRENLWHFLNSLRNVTPDSAGSHRFHNLLEHFPDFFRQGYFWIDQICIQQYDTIERNHQVRRMGQIYQGASEVLIWLGTSDIGDDGKPIVSSKEWTTSVDLPVASSNPPPKAMDLSRRPYWHRLWIIQEIMLARKVLIFHNDKLEEWEEFFGLPSGGPTRARRILPGVRPLPQIVQSIIKERDAFQKIGPGNSLSYVLELFSFEGSECENPRDKVYGLLGLVKESAAIEIDYEKSVEEVFFDVINKVVRDENYLSLGLVVEFSRLLQTSMNLDQTSNKTLVDHVIRIKRKEDKEWVAYRARSRQKIKAAVGTELDRLRGQIGEMDESLRSFLQEFQDRTNQHVDESGLLARQERTRSEAERESEINFNESMSSFIALAKETLRRELDVRERKTKGQEPTQAERLLYQILKEEHAAQRASVYLPLVHARTEFVPKTMDNEEETWEAICEPSRQIAKDLMLEEIDRLRLRLGEVDAAAAEPFLVQCENIINHQYDKSARSNFRNYASLPREIIESESIAFAKGFRVETRQILLGPLLSTLYEQKRREKGGPHEASPSTKGLRRLCEILQEEEDETFT